jgi:hypothetical protein
VFLLASCRSHRSQSARPVDDDENLSIDGVKEMLLAARQRYGTIESRAEDHAACSARI